MARNTDRERSKKRGAKDTGRRTRKKVCLFCTDHIDHVDYKDVSLLRKFMSDRGKIRTRESTGTCAQHQRDVAVAIKRARELVLMPYSQRTTSTDKPGGRGAGRGRAGFSSRDARPVETADVSGGTVDMDLDAVAADEETSEPVEAT